MSVEVSPPAELRAELAALQALAARHRREYMRLRTLEMAKLTGEPARFTRDRMTREQLAALPDVVDATGEVLHKDDKVWCPDGMKAVVRRVDKRSRRCVVDREDGTAKMVVAHKLRQRGRKRVGTAGARATQSLVASARESEGGSAASSDDVAS